jgi:hypothetical protein
MQPVVDTPNRHVVSVSGRAAYSVHASGPLAVARRFLTRLWRTDPLLTGTGLCLLALLAPAALGLVLDPREILGAPLWLKPSKFALSTGIYTLTLAWVFTYLPDWPRTRRLVGRTTAVVMPVEVAIIALQAWRGTTSHFNVGTPLDATLFSVMGVAIFAQTAASVAVAVALWRQPFVDRALGWALRLGMTITIVGAFTGGLMTRPTEAQLADARTTGRIMLAGAHTVGAPDGGPGLPVTGWSTRHGDLRVPHFIGLHALQVLPFVALVVLRRLDDEIRARLVIAAAAVHVLVFVTLLVRALQGVPFVPIG